MLSLKFIDSLSESSLNIFRRSSRLVWALLALMLGSCAKEEVKQALPSGAFSGWLVPLEQLSIRENAHDRIQSNDDPVFVDPAEVMIGDDDEVLVCRSGEEVRIYPLNIVRQHEIVNDTWNGLHFSVTYCPLTGSALAWNRELNGKPTTFGVSGSLFNNNLIAYDRETESYWSQMLLAGIKGGHGGDRLRHEPLLSTTYASAIRAYPEARVLYSDGYNQPCDSICPPPSDPMHGSGSIASAYTDGFYGVIDGEEALLFDYTLFGDSIRVIRTSFYGKPLLVAGSSKLRFVTAFFAPSSAVFRPLQESFPAIMTDGQGNHYDLTGYVMYGPLKGQRLEAPFAYAARAFAWELFFETRYY